jgi:hypothetical protein
MRQRFFILHIFIIFVGWISLLLFSTPVFSQAPREYRGKAEAALKEPDVVTSSVSGFLRDVVIQPTSQSVKVELIGEGLISTYQSFKLSHPPRLVIDFPNIFSSYPKKFINVNRSLLTDIRLGQYPDKLRTVFTFPGTVVPSYEIRKETKGLTIWIGKVEKEPAEPQKSIPEEKKEPPVKSPSEGKSLPEKAPVAAAIPQEKIPEEKKGIALETKTKEETKALYSGTKVSLDYVNADIRNIFRLLAEAGKVEIIPAPEVRGTITLRLIDVPWDEALDAILKFHNLRKIQAGNKIRILLP